jgi:hypothetical protein
VETTHRQHLDRGEDEIEVTVTCQWSFNPGETIEPGHSFNGYGKGWECDEVTAVDDNGNRIELTPREHQFAREQAESERESTL